MALVFADRVQETTTTGFAGTGDVQLNGVPASPLGRVTFADGVGDGNRCKFLIDDSQGNWEISEGAVTTTGSPHTLTRDRVIASSASGSKVNFFAGMKDITLVATSEDVGRSPHGQCRLSLDGADLKLSRHNGRWLVIDGLAREIPAGGATLSPTGLTADTDYFVYAYMNGQAVSLEASTTGHATDSATGIEVKSGDSTRSLIGAARPVTGPVWIDSASQRLVLSYFNRRPRRVWVKLTASSTSSTTAVPIGSEQLDFLAWGDESAIFNMNGGFLNLTTVATGRFQIEMDGNGLGSTLQVTTQHGTAGYGEGIGVLATATPAEGHHVVKGLHRTDAGQTIHSEADLEGIVWG